MEKLLEQEEMLKKIYRSVESTRKYFLFTLIGSALTVIVPLVALAIAIPLILNSISSINPMNSITIPSQLNELKQLGL